MVVGNGDAVNALGLNLPNDLLGDGERRGLEVEGFPDVRV
jgi:hypothetical protein